ncbi:dynamin like protein [Tieghemostelium lacteum]|uniref:Dynamin like protein n=1 Tax=Tieghemostelium lacteum TaxID=361077 RepID=A0A151ZGK5_TIELA|nr:dynamin like protein [Tieghemostelium lacteum]|eukprot:KYQ93102.1 dynamin like protein [Tieghemostelium lacteum]
MDRPNTKSMVLPFPLNFDNDKYIDLYKSFNKIMTLARDLNTQIEIPEFIFLGKDGSGKSILIESLIGLPLGIAGTTYRPIAITMVNNLLNEKPVFTIKRDRFLNSFEIDKQVELDELTLEITKRNAKTNVPIRITIEYKNCLNMVLIEPPSLQNGFKLSSLDDLQMSLSSKSQEDHKVLVFVEKSSASLEESNELMEFAKKIDPKLDRSIFVFNRFHDHLQTFTQNKDLNKYLQDLSKPNCFFTTLPNNEQRLKCKTKDQLRDICDQLNKKDQEILEQLQFDKKYARSMGIQSFIHFASELTWKRYQESIPEVLKRLRSFRKNSSDQLLRLKNQISNMNSGNLRVIASNYVMEFLQNIEKLVFGGTLEGNPALNGQTLAEEKQQDDVGEWYDYNHKLLENLSKKVQYHDSKLYGGQQFERLLSEFKNISEVVELGDLSTDEIATSLGSNRPHNVSNLAWAASDIAQKKAKDLLVPLIDQLFRRQTYILKRLADIVDKMIENKKKIQLRRQNSGNSLSFDPKDQGSSNGSSKTSETLLVVEDHPYFIYAIKEMYFKFINEVSVICKNKCMDEFYTTRLIYWELNNNKELKRLSETTSKSKAETMSIVANLSSKLFQDIRARIVKNIMLKCYDFFLIPMQNELRKQIQGQITVLSDKTLDELFEVLITKERLIQDEKHLAQITNQFQQQEENFLISSNMFSYPFKNIQQQTVN